MARITGYTYEADLHCPACTKGATQRMKLDHHHPYAMGKSCKDQNGVEYDLIDAEGNLIRPLFVTDEHPSTPTCADCGAQLT